MTRLDEVLDDLAAEVAALDALLATLTPEQWALPTPAEGWDVKDTVSHLADTDDLAYDCITGGPRDLLAEGAASGSGEAFTRSQILKGRDREPHEVLSWWREATGKVDKALRNADPNERVPWGPNKITPASFATARLMETWAHSLDVFAAVGQQPADTDRLRHVAFLGLRALAYAFSRAGLPAPAPVRAELVSPGGQMWRIGPDDAPNVITATASDWCRVATQRDRAGERARVRAEGPDGEAILQHAQAYL